MRRSPNFTPLLAIVVIAVVVGIFVGWWFSRDTAQPVRPVVKHETPPETTVTEPVAKAETNAEAAPQPVETQANVSQPAAPDWSDEVDRILTDDKIPIEDKADKFADMVAKLPEEPAREVAEHLINLVSDEDFYKKTAGIVINPKTPKSVASVIFDDMMNRNDGLRLPLTLMIAKNESHPLYKEARELLEMSVQEDFGTDWDKWQNAISEQLKNQGLEEDPNIASILQQQQ